MTAGIYAARARLDAVLLESKPLTGGQILTTDVIENYPGFPEPISGAELMERMAKQASRFGLKVETAHVTAVKPQADGAFALITAAREYFAQTVIIATGTENRKLGVPGEREFWGMGVTTCATCDGPLYRDRPVAVVGGGDSAVKEAVYLTKFAAKVYIVHRRNQLRAEKIIQETALTNPKIEVVWDTVVTAIRGGEGVEGVALRNVKTGEETELAVDGVFLYVGVQPNTEAFQGLVKLDEAGRVVTDEEMRTSVPGVFAAGDCRAKAFKQVATAVGEGAAAAYAAQEYLEARARGQ